MKTQYNMVTILKVGLQHTIAIKTNNGKFKRREVTVILSGHRSPLS